MVSSIRPSRWLALAVAGCLLSSPASRAAASSASGNAAGHAALPPGWSRNVAAGDDVVATGTDGTNTYAIVVDSVRRLGDATAFDEQAGSPGSDLALHHQVIVDCARKLRAVRPADAASGAPLLATHPRAGSREEHELALACAMPEGPRSRWFAGIVVAPDGVVVAPRDRTLGCAAVSTGVGAARRTLELIAHDENLTLLRVRGGGPWPVMPSADAPAGVAALPVTLLGVSGIEPRASAAFAEQAGSNGADPGWPQVRTLSRRAQREGLVWDATGTAIGIAWGGVGPVARSGQSFVRMLPASRVRTILQRHRLDWKFSRGSDVDGDSAMRRAIAATLPLICSRQAGMP